MNEEGRRLGRQPEKQEFVVGTEWPTTAYIIMQVCNELSGVVRPLFISSYHN